MLKITKNQGSIQVTADNSGFYPFDGTLTFPTNSLFTATSANTDMVTFKSTSNGDVQFVGNYKDITISGRSYDTKQKFLTAFSNLANQGSVDAYTKAETDAKIDAKQGKLKAGNGITLTEDATDNTTVVKTAVSLTDNGNGAYAVGDSIEIDPYDTVRIGRNTTSGSGTRGSVVMGNSASITGICNVAIGFDAAGNNSGTAVGYRTTTTGDNATAIGYQAKARSNNAIAVGSNSISNGENSIAVGNVSSATNSSSIAIGASSSVSGENSIAIGYDTINPGIGCVLIGDASRTGEEDSGSVVIGCNANGYSGIYSTLIGYGANSNGFGCTGIGPTATVNETTPLAINAGYKTVGDYKQMLTMIQGDANGKISLLKGDGSDERMVIQDEIAALKNAGGSGGGTVDAYTKAETDTKLDAKQDKLTAGSGITITKDETAGTSTIATAVSLTDNGNGHYTIGDSIKMSNGIAIGKNASGYNYSVAIGNNAVSTDSFNAVIGQSAISHGGYSVAVGSGAEVGQYSNRCVAIGYNAQASNDNSVSIGNFAKANKDKPLVINAGYKTVDGHRQNLTVLQSDSTGKLSILKGDGTDERIVIQDALSAGGSGGTVDAYTKAETDNLLNAKQNTLTAGTGITIDENNVISSTGGTGGSANPLVNVKGTGSATIPDNITDAVAIGSGAKVTEELSVAIGAANALSGHCVAIGGGANATKMSSVAIGDGACATAHMFDVAIGFHAATTDTKPLEINAGYKTIGGATTPLTVLQSDKTGKLSILKGDGTDERIVIQDALSAGGSGGTVDAYTKAETDTKLDAKQDKLKAGNGITLTEDATDNTTVVKTAVSLTDNGNGAYAVGDSIEIGSDTVVIGKSAISRSESSIAIGKSATSGSGTENVAIGLIANSSGGSSIAIGNKTETSNMYAIAIGTLAGAYIPKSIAIGYNAEAKTNTPMVINAGGKTMIQSDSDGKISLLKGDGTVERIVIQDEITALKAEITTLKAEIAALKGGASTGA